MPFYNNVLLNTVLRIDQAVLSIISLGLSANTVHYYMGGAAGYLLFTSLWTLLALAYLHFAPKYWPSAVFHKFALLGVEILTNVFWFCAFISNAAVYGPYSCSGTVSYWDSFYGEYIYYKYSLRSPCRTSKAGIAMAAINWALFVVTTAAMCLVLFRKPQTDVEKADHPVPVPSAQETVPQPAVGQEVGSAPVDAVQVPEPAPVSVSTQAVEQEVTTEK